jgi:hydroxyacylglutathione hydrolase
MKERSFGPVRFIPGQNNGKYPYCHSLFIEGAGILIDPASDRQRLETLRDNQEIRAVWLSHWHEDHFMHLDLFDDVPLAMHAADAPFLKNLESFLDGYGITDTKTREAWKPLLEDIFHFRPRQPDILLEEKQALSMGNVTFDILHTPGHTPGHLCFFFREPEVLFLADYDLTPFGPYYGDRHASIADTKASVRRLQRRPARVWLTCHEKGVFEAAPPALWNNYLDVIRQRRDALMAHLAEPRSMNDIVEAWIAYKRPREPQAFYRQAEQFLMTKHLEELMLAGQVVLVEEKYRRT